MFEIEQKLRTRGRRHWPAPTRSEAENLRIVTESLGPGWCVIDSGRHGISPSLLFAWPRSFRAVLIAKSVAQATLVPVLVGSEAAPTLQADPSRGRV
jgi:transposase-like protein